MGDDLKDLPQSLTELDLSRCTITDDALVHLKHLENLHTLKLNCCTINGSGLEYLRGLGITSLDLSMCNNIEFKYLEQLEKLSCLFLGGPHVTDATLQSLPENLSALYLYACNNVTDQGLQYLPQSLTKLELYHCRRVTSDGLRYLSNLTELYLLSCNMNSKGISPHLKKFPNLKILLLPNGERYEGKKLQEYLK